MNVSVSEESRCPGNGFMRMDCQHDEFDNIYREQDYRKEFRLISVF